MVSRKDGPIGSSSLCYWAHETIDELFLKNLPPDASFVKLLCHGEMRIAMYVHLFGDKSERGSFRAWLQCSLIVRPDIELV